MVHIEIRKSILSSRTRGNTIAEIAIIYGVTERTVYNLLSLYRETGDVNQRGEKKGRKPVLSEKDL